MGTTDICELLTEEIYKSGLSQAEIARRAGFDKRTIWAWYNREKTPSLENAQCVLAVFGKELVIREKEDNAK